MKDYKILFADLDGTLIDTISGETFPKGIWDMKLRFDVLDKIKELKPDYVYIVTNQGGIESGFVDELSLSIKLEYLSRVIRDYCGCKCYYDYCRTNNKNDQYRKPNIGMLTLLYEVYLNDAVYKKSSILMIGDASGKEGQFSDTDKKTAENFGIDYMDVADFVGGKNTWLETIYDQAEKDLL